MPGSVYLLPGLVSWAALKANEYDTFGTSDLMGWNRNVINLKREYPRACILMLLLQAHRVR